MVHKLYIERVDSYEGFLKLERAWDELLRESDADNPFLTFEWMSTWWQHYGSGKELFILIVKENGKAVAIAPLMKSRNILFRVIEFIGTGRSDYLDIIAARKKERIVESIMSYLLSVKREWDLINLQDLPFFSATIEEMNNGAQLFGLGYAKYNCEVAPYLYFEGKWDDYLATKSKKHRYNILREFKKQQESMEVISPDKGEFPLDERLKMVCEVEKNSWKVEAGNPRLSEGIAAVFFKDVLKKFEERRWLETWIALMNGKPVSYIINFFYGGKIYNYNIAYDKAYHPIAAGKYLTTAVMMNLFDRGIREYDFLRGDESYKEFWTKEKRLLYQIVLWQNGIRAISAYFFLVKIKWILKRYPFFMRLNELKVKYRYKFRKLLMPKGRNE